MLRKRTDWTRPLPQPLHILDGDKPLLTLATVGDVRALIVKRLPAESREKSTWQYVAGLALEAANGGDSANPSVALRQVLSLEGITIPAKLTAGGIPRCPPRAASHRPGRSRSAPNPSS